MDHEFKMQSNFSVAANEKGVSERRNKLIEEYYKEVQPDNMTFKEFENICKTPFVHAKSKLASRTLYDIRYKYFGKFTPKPNQLVWLLTYTHKRYKENLITQKTYSTTVVMITDYISSNAKVFERFKEKLKPWIEL